MVSPVLVDRNFLGIPLDQVSELQITMGLARPRVVPECILVLNGSSPSTSFCLRAESF